MSRNPLHPKKYILLMVILSFALLSAVAAVIVYTRSASLLSQDNIRQDDGRMKEDLERLAAESYESVLLSMHSTAGFSEEDFKYYRGLDTLITSHALLSAEELSSYLNCILGSGNPINHIYLCLDPELLWADARKQSSRWDSLLRKNLYRYIEENSDITFEILLPYPYIHYWLNLKEKDFNTILTTYSSLVSGLSVYSNTRIFFPGMEYWLMVNPDNYDHSCFEANAIVTQKLFLYTFCDGVYQITPENMDTCWDTLRSIVIRETTTPTEYPDLSDWCVVFFGDSVFANYPGSYGIPGYMEGLSGAATRNYAVGGTSSAAFPGAVKAFLEETASLPFAQEKICFIIQYGLNDYFTGANVENPDNPFDTSSYQGALRTGITTLRSVYPQAGFLLVTPTHISLFENGTAVMSETGDVLSAYVEAAEETAAELNVYCMDNYNDSVITADNLDLYISDGVHPNELGRLTIASDFMNFIHSHME